MHYFEFPVSKIDLGTHLVQPILILRLKLWKVIIESKNNN